ncbi:tRNA m(1)G methyltransferase, putative [Plasmodium sp. gorilla clade G1]|nr:tRNA m(1)G methyltransferase, putative [Plasmodium sp. gorilla clade G1]
MKQEEEDEAHEFLGNFINVIDPSDINKNGRDKKKKTKKEKKKEKREHLKEKRKKKRPEEKKRKKEKKREALLKILNNLNEEEKIAFLKERKLSEIKKKEEKKQFLIKSYNEGYKICFNCSFQNLMEEKEISSLAKQIFLSYHYMLKKKVPVQFHFTHMNDNDDISSTLKKYSFDKWMVHIHKDDYWNIFNKDKIVVLSPDASEELEEIKKDEVYIISALVDRSVSKNLSFYQASLHGLKTRKLPLEKYIKKKKSNVLNVNTVVEILIHYIKTPNWLKVFETCIPQKKVMCFFYDSSSSVNEDERIIKVDNEICINEKKDIQVHF